MRARWAALALLTTLGACSGTTPFASSSGGEAVVFAAASLTEAFADLSRAFEDRHAGSSVLLSLAGSQQLARQILDGAPADLFASADRRQVDLVLEAGRVEGEPTIFARNRLVIVVERGNPLGIRELSDLARPGSVVVMAAEQVPAGRYARQALARARVVLEPRSVEADVRAVLAKVALGEADAGIVYASDVVGAGDRVEAVAIPAEHSPVAEYWIARLDGPGPQAARDFLALALSPDGREILARHGFLSP